MEPLVVRPFAPELTEVWNSFVQQSKNGVFLFDRGYMDYHSDRFTDASLLVYEADELIALLPANRAGETVSSHGGLTFGGFITGTRMRAAVMLAVFEAVLELLRRENVRTFVYKSVPHIYHRLPAEEDAYALFRNGFRLVRRDVSSTLPAGRSAGYTKGRKSSIGKGKRLGIEARRSDDWDRFMKIEEDHLVSKYGKKPVHTADEMRLLAGRFPEAVRLYAGMRGEEMLGGVIVYESERVAHAQYIAATDDGKEASALDVVVDFLINNEYREKPYFDFGISTEQSGQYLNAGLIANKESYGARATVYDVYEAAL
jgi:hypothetical protein